MLFFFMRVLYMISSKIKNALDLFSLNHFYLLNDDL